MVGEKIKNAKDLIEVLKQNPELLEELRRIILTEELLNVPKKLDELSKKFESFVNEEFKPLAEKVDRMEVKITEMDGKITEMDGKITEMDGKITEMDGKITEMDGRLTRVEKRLDNVENRLDRVERDVEQLKADVAKLKGSDFERSIKEKAPAYFGRIIRGCKVISHESLALVLEDAVDKGIITEEEKDNALLVDIVVTGRLKHNTNKEVVIAVEVSTTVDKNDVQRSYIRSQTISKGYGKESIGICIGEKITKGAEKKAKELNIITLIV